MARTAQKTFTWLLLIALVLGVTTLVAVAAPPESITYRDPGGNTIRVSPDGSARETVATQLGSASRILPSPDGMDILVFNGTKLLKAEPSGANSQDLSTSGYSYSTNFAWSPSGAQIAFAGKNASTSYQSVFVMNADGSSPALVTTAGSAGNQQVFDWGSPGILYRTPVGTTTITYPLFVIQPNGTGMTQVLPNTWTVNDARYSPDGSMIAFIGKNGTGANGIYVMNANGTGITLVNTTVLNANSLDWKSDGTTAFYNTIAVSAKDSTASQAYYKIFTIDVGSAAATEVPNATASTSGTTNYVHWGPLAAANNPPDATPLSASTNEDTPKVLTLVGTDIDGQSLSFAVASTPAHGTLGAVSASSCTVAGSTSTCSATVTYSPSSNYNGSDGFSFTANDGNLTSTPAPVNLTVVAVNDPPTGIGHSFSTNEDTPINRAVPGVLTGAADIENDPLTAVIVTGPAHGTVTLNPNGSFIYTPAANYNGTDSFIYRIFDGTDYSANQTVTISIAPVNDAPTAVNDVASTLEDTLLTVATPGVLSNDQDVDGDPMTAQLVSGPSHGTLTLNADGSYTYLPAPNYYGSDSFTYRVTDGVLTSANATVNITVTAVNDPPVATNDSYTTPEDTALTVPVGTGLLVNDTDPDGDPLTVVVSPVTVPAHGTVTLNANGTFTYTPATNYNGPDSFTYRVSDGLLQSAPATVNINVTPVNDAPVAVNDSYTTAEDTALTITAPGLLANDTDVEGDPLTVAALSVTAPANGTVVVNADGSFTYTPALNYFGTDSF